MLFTSTTIVNVKNQWKWCKSIASFGLQTLSNFQLLSKKKKILFEVTNFLYCYCSYPDWSHVPHLLQVVLFAFSVLIQVFHSVTRSFYSFHLFKPLSNKLFYSISKHCGAVLIGGWCLIDRGPFFKVRTVTHMKFQNFIVFFL